MSAEESINYNNDNNNNDNDNDNDNDNNDNNNEEFVLEKGIFSHDETDDIIDCDATEQDLTVLEVQDSSVQDSSTLEITACEKTKDATETEPRTPEDAVDVTIYRPSGSMVTESEVDPITSLLDKKRHARAMRMLDNEPKFRQLMTNVLDFWGEKYHDHEQLELDQEILITENADQTRSFAIKETTLKRKLEDADAESRGLKAALSEASVREQKNKRIAIDFLNNIKKDFNNQATAAIEKLEKGTI